MVQTFTRNQRLLKPDEFSHVFDQPMRLSDRFFTVLVKKQSPPAQGRLGLAIAKKNLKKSHDRNLVKRIIRETFRLDQDKLKGFDVVVLVKRDISLDNRSLLHQSLKKHWARVANL